MLLNSRKNFSSKSILNRSKFKEKFHLWREAKGGKFLLEFLSYNWLLGRDLSCAYLVNINTSASCRSCHNSLLTRLGPAGWLSFPTGGFGSSGGAIILSGLTQLFRLLVILSTELSVARGSLSSFVWNNPFPDCWRVDVLWDTSISVLWRTHGCVGRRHVTVYILII